MKKLLIFFGALAAISSVQAQKFSTKNGHIEFFAHAVSDIKAENNTTMAILDASTSQLAFKTLIASFQFEKALMQTHFNEDMDSKTFPAATFEGKLKGFSAESLKKDGTVTVTAEGNLTIHGVTKPVSVPATLTVAGGKVTGAKADFKVSLKDYQVKVRSGVPGEVSVKVNITNFM